MARGVDEPYGYCCESGYMGLIREGDRMIWMLFSTEQEYIERLKENHKKTH